MEMGMNIHVMMPYADSLKYISDWYAQLWAESLGKNVTLDGRPCNVGQTPIKTLGVTDQHSQVQLYTEGPFDKVVTFLGVEKYRAVTPSPRATRISRTCTSWAARATTSSSRRSRRPRLRPQQGRPCELHHHPARGEPLHRR